MEQIHGHEVMHMMLESGGSFTRASLRLAIHQRFGETARFYTCSSENMAAEELIHFLEKKGKFQIREDAISTTADQICKH